MEETSLKSSFVPDSLASIDTKTSFMTVSMHIMRRSQRLNKATSEFGATKIPGFTTQMIEIFSANR